jgi:hypothetical protein
MLLAGQRGGIRALSSLAPTLTQANIQQNQAIALDIDNQYRQNKINEAQGQMQVQNMIEERYRNTLAGLQQERSAGLQDTYTGLSNLSQSIMAGGSAIANAKNGQKVDKLELDGASKQGVNPFNNYPINNPFAGMQNSQSNAPLDFSFVRYGERKGY